LAPNKFQEAVWRFKNMRKPFIGQGCAPDPTGGAYSAPTDPLAGGGGVGCPLPQALPPFSALWALPLTQNRRLGPSKHDGLDLPLSHRSSC